MIEEELRAVVDQLESVNRSLADLNKTVIDSSTPNVLLKAVWPVLIVCLVIHYVDIAWHSSWRYSIQYSVSRDHIQIVSEPHDCDFLAVPLGSKHCNYKVSVSIVKWAKSTTGEPIVSDDDGKTWTVFTPEEGASVPQQPTVERVFIGWEKTDVD